MADDDLPTNVFESARNGRIVPSEISEQRIAGETEEVVSFEPEDPGAERVVGLTLTTEEFRRSIDKGRLERTDPDPSALNMRRSPEARASDRGKDAEITTDPLQWAQNPDEFDYPGVDAGPTFRDNFDEDDFFDF